MRLAFNLVIYFGSAICKDRRQYEIGDSFESVKVVLDRTYKDRSGNYSSTHSLDVNDIPKAIFALMKAYEYLMEGHEESEVAIEKS
jgi:hypothetical protein